MINIRISSLTHPASYLALALPLFLGAAMAQSGVGVSPARVELNALAGAQVTELIVVDNPSTTRDLNVAVVVSDSLLGADGSMIWVPPGSHSNSLSPWLAVNPLEFDLSPGERRNVSYTLDVPSDAGDGTYWAVLFFETSEPAPPGAEAQAGVAVISRVRVGFTIYLTVGQPTHEGRIVGMQFSAENPDGTINVSFQNSGTGLMRLSGRLELRDANGSLVQEATISNQVSFPGATHALEFRLSEPIESGIYTALVALNGEAGRVIVGETTVRVP